jgi:magnesium-protoporphyrin O-methyltransferase
MFNGRFARWCAARYRKKGLDKTGRRMVNLLAQRTLDGATVLEIGGGVGEISVELVRRGAASATNLEISPAYETEAARLVADVGLTDRVQHRLLDIAEDPADVEPADFVVLNRVVCCYPDYQKLLGAAADRTRRQLVFSHPPRNQISRAVIGTQNLWFRMRGWQFRIFPHPPAAMLDVLAEHGLQPTAVRGGRVWHIATGTR